MPAGRTDRPIHVAVALSGGISLGAFFGGVTYELVRLAQRRPDLLVADVWAGASAGGMNAAIACFCLTLQRDPLPIFRAWVEQAELVSMLDGGPASLLDSDYVGRIIDESMPASDGAELAPLHDQHHYLGMTVTNLNGLVCKPHPLSRLRLKNHAETRRFHLHARAPGAALAASRDAYWQGIWEKIKISARMCGAFPVAFAPLEDDSTLFPVPSANLREAKLDDTLYQASKGVYPVADGRSLQAFYSDGGIVHNKPIRLAIELVEDLERATGEPCPERRHLFINGHKVTSLDDGSIRRRAFDHLDVAAAGISLSREQQLYADLRLIMRRNDQVKARDRLRQRLRKELSLGSHDPLPGSIEVLLAGEDSICPYRHVDLDFVTPMDALRVYECHSLLRPDVQQKVADWRRHYAGVAWEELGADQWEELERRLRTEELLASDFLQAFGGFFRKEYRDYDFAWGRLSAIGWLRRSAAGNGAAGSQLMPGGVLSYLDDAPGLTPIAAALDLPTDPDARQLSPRDRLQLSRLAARGLSQVGADLLARSGGEPRSQEGIEMKRSLAAMLGLPISALLKLISRTPLLVGIAAGGALAAIAAAGCRQKG